MKTIYPLPSDVVAKIAAGEVVQNPASIAKELIENSLDAGATCIEISLTNGGIDAFHIRDNGRGMSKEDLAVCFLPHTTSKITSADDLFALDSFGFRGEALWSVASVSTMHIRSRQAGAPSGHEVIIKEGTVVEQQPAGIPEGTDIFISHLFSSVPARKKFLKDPATEARSVADVVLQFALSFPGCGFKLSHNDKVLLHISPEQTQDERLRAVLGEYVSQHSLPISHESRYGTISGYIGRPQLSGRSRAHQYVFVNNRSVSSAPISKYVNAAYSNLIEPRSYPVFVLFLNLPKDHIDVNIHPRKEEVAFIYEQEVAQALQEAIIATLEAHNLTYRDVQDEYNDINGMNATTASMLRSSLTPWNVKDIGDQEILQINNLYLIAPTDKGVLLIDQHAAHERILYEQFHQAFIDKKSEATVFQLPEHVLFDLPRGDALLLEQELEKFQSIGFDIEHFGEFTFKLSAVPEVFKDRNYAQTILEVLQQMKDVGIQAGRGSVDKETDRTLSFLACRTAIKGGEALTNDEKIRLVKKLLEVSDAHKAYTCPHGRPTHIEVSLSELDRMFKRKM
ncbi:MAG: hypothetical protein RL094_389 [Candidatus Parcubacteria bacterium]|jgi:DNA mismatch repair protein MutL